MGFILVPLMIFFGIIFLVSSVLMSVGFAFKITIWALLIPIRMFTRVLRVLIRS